MNISTRNRLLECDQHFISLSQMLNSVTTDNQNPDKQGNFIKLLNQI